MKVRVAAVILKGTDILLIEHRRRGRAYWTLPGGGLEEGETLQACLLREVKEETGLDVEVRRLLFVADVIPDNPSNGHTVNLIFHAAITGGDLTPGHGGRLDETHDRVEFVPLTSVPALGLYPPIVPEIAQTFAEEFGGPTLYLGNLWREIETAQRVGGAAAE
ncbi:MAG TPA: NUDIX domain-containing protein [Chthonomonadaceae bacterium]|nr:NUDIX domain-containing protein [Chthonomonadaceae bacterium]